MSLRNNLTMNDRAAKPGKTSEVKKKIGKGKRPPTNEVSKESDNEGEEDEGDQASNDELNDEQQEMINKITNLPIEKLKQIITDQIDLEIRLKHKELSLTEEEIGKCESQMITLRNYFQIPREKSISSEPNDFTIKYYDLLNRSLSINYDSNEFKEMMNNLSGLSNVRDSLSSDGSSFSHNASFNNLHNFNLLQQQHQQQPHDSNGNGYRTRSTTATLRPPTSIAGKPLTIGCLYRRTDGIIVKLTCPDCKRSNFSSAQGFLNHSRIAHTQEYTSQDAAALICGEILPDNEQDEEGLASLKNLKLKNLDPAKNLNINEIYFNGLSNSLNTVHKSHLEKSLSPLDNEVYNDPMMDTKTKRMGDEESELMKKFIKNGLGNNKQDFEKYLEDFKRKDFDGDIISDDDEEIAEESKSVKESQVKDIKDVKVQPEDKESKVEKNKVEKNKFEKNKQEPIEGDTDNKSPKDDKRKRKRSHEHPPLPKLKLKLRSDDKKRRLRK